MERTRRGNDRTARPSAASARGAVCAALVAIGAAGCIGSLDHRERFLDGGDTGSSVDTGGRTCMPGYDVPRDLFARSCNNAGCHDSTASGGLNLQSANVASRLVGVHAMTPGCTDRLLIDPADLSRSFLIVKLGTPPSMCGSRMPLGGTPLTQAEIDCVYVWAANLVGGGPAPDASGNDATVMDTGTPMDSGTPMDTGTPPRDTGTDTGPRDTGPRDTGTDAARDTGTDTGPRDTGTTDAARDAGADADM